MSVTNALFIKIMDSVRYMSPVPAFFPLLLSAIKSDQYTPAAKTSSNVTKSIMRQREKTLGSVGVGAERRGKNDQGKWKEQIGLCVLRYKCRGYLEKKKSLSVLIKCHSVVNSSVVLDEWLNTHLPHNYSLPSKSPVCLGAQCIKHVCHSSPSPSLLAAAAHALFLTLMMEA